MDTDSIMTRTVLNHCIDQLKDVNIDDQQQQKIIKDVILMLDNLDCSFMGDWIYDTINT